MDVPIPTLNSAELGSFENHLSALVDDIRSARATSRREIVGQDAKSVEDDEGGEESVVINQDPERFSRANAPGPLAWRASRARSRSTTPHGPRVGRATSRRPARAAWCASRMARLPVTAGATSAGTPRGPEEKGAKERVPAAEAAADRPAAMAATGTARGTTAPGYPPIDGVRRPPSPGPEGTRPPGQLHAGLDPSGAAGLASDRDLSPSGAAGIDPGRAHGDVPGEPDHGDSPGEPGFRIQVIMTAIGNQPK